MGPTGRDGSRATTWRVGVTDYAQDALGDIVFVTLPEAGSQVTAGQPCGEIESTKSVSDVFAPVTGTVVERNEAWTPHRSWSTPTPTARAGCSTIRPDDPLGQRPGCSTRRPTRPGWNV